MPRLSTQVLAAGPDTYAQVGVLTNLVVGSKQAYRILRYGYEIYSPAASIFPSNTIAEQKLEMCWSPKSSVSMQVGWIDEVAAKKNWSVGVAAANLARIPFPVFAEFDYEDPDPFYIIEDYFYFSHKSLATAFTYGIGMWVDVELLTITDAQRIALLTSRLS